MIKRIVLILLIFGAVVVAVWAAFRFVRPKWQGESGGETAGVAQGTGVNSWEQAIEKAKADRGEPTGGSAGVETPPELKHYSERHWFLATQVAEIAKYKVHTSQDYMDLAAMIQRGEMVSVPWVTETYVLFGIGERADDGPFSQSEDDRIEIHNESLQALAKNFGGRSYDLNNAADRQAMKINMLSALRPQALKVLEEVASAYHRQFDRPLPVSSLVRPEQYQRALRRVNRNATLIETPPHSTGLAFDIDYRYLSGPEQSFVMGELARLKREGRIEAIRERNANYHVFAFVNGARPSDELIGASLEEAGGPVEQAHHATPSKQTKSRKARSNVRQNRKRR